MLTTAVLIGINLLVSFIMFSIMNKPAGRMATFSPNAVAAGREYPGMILSHFSHGDATHLLFNMVTLYYFGPVVEQGLGPLKMLLIYVSAGILATVVVYYRHRAQPEYRALGASDSISGILFAAIVLDPEMRLLIIFIPFVPIPAPLFAVLYIVVSTFFMQRGKGNISHEAHLAGAFCGLILGGLFAPYGFRPLLFELKNLLG
jgi:membrane associated rhomboid family serine protease